MAVLTINLPPDRETLVLWAALLGGIIAAVYVGGMRALLRKERSVTRATIKTPDIDEKEAHVILDHVPEGIVAVDDRGEIRLFNKTAVSQFQYEAQEMIGKRINLLMPPAQMGLREGILKRAVQEDYEVLGAERNFVAYRKDGSSFPMAVTVNKMSFGRKTLYVGIIRDISAQKEKEDDFRQIIERAETANRTKSEFLANMSHELRTPLNGIMGTAQLLQSSPLSPDQQHLISIVYQSSNNLLKIVNDILDLSKIEAGEVQMETIGFDPYQILSMVMHELALLAREKGLPIIRQYEYEALPYLVGDPLRFKRILTNLVSNAVKYTNQGHIEVRAKVVRLNETHVEFRCEVADTGIGISPEKLSSVFDKFVQADNSTTRRYGGTGLGLAITRELVLRMAGKIGVDSIAGEGSTFWFVIPFETTEKLYIEDAMTPEHRGGGRIAPDQARLLIAEDQPMNQMLIKQVMHKFGVDDFEIAATGLEALAAYRERGPWTAVLMDCYMPDMNGYDATKAIRDLEQATGAHVPIIAMTANAMVGDKEKCLQAGMDEYISKPINMRILHQTLAAWIAFDATSSGTPLKPISSGRTHPVNLKMLSVSTTGSLETAREHVGKAMEKLDSLIDILGPSSAIEEDIHVWLETTQQLMGLSGDIGAGYLRQICGEAHAYKGDATGRTDLAQKIMGELAHVKAYLKQEGFL